MATHNMMPPSGGASTTTPYGRSYTSADGVPQIAVPEVDCEVLEANGWSRMEDASLFSPTTVSTQTGAAYTFAAGDAGGHVMFSSSSSVTATIPTNASVSFPIGTTIWVEQTGAGVVTVAAANGVTLHPGGGHGAAVAEQYGVIGLRKTAINTWVLFGDMSTS